MPAYLLLAALLALAAPLSFTPTPAAASQAKDHIVLVGHDADDAYDRDRFEDRADHDDDALDDDEDRYGYRPDDDDDDDTADYDDDDDSGYDPGYHRT